MVTFRYSVRQMSSIEIKITTPYITPLTAITVSMIIGVVLPAVCFAIAYMSGSQLEELFSITPDERWSRTISALFAISFYAGPVCASIFGFSYVHRHRHLTLPHRHFLIIQSIALLVAPTVTLITPSEYYSTALVVIVVVPLIVCVSALWYITHQKLRARSS